VANPLKTALNIQFNHPFLEAFAPLVQLEKENLLGILGTPSRSESITASLKGRLMSGFEGVFSKALPSSIGKGWHS